MTLLLPDAQLVNAADLVAMLRRHYLPEGRPAGGIFASEIESPDGRRRADALWCPWSIAGGDGLVGHEVKVSRSDVLAELADPMKAEPWSKYCSRWWLVVADPSLVDGLDVPEPWGIMSPPSGRRRRTMTVVRQAPKLKPHDTGPGWRRVAAWNDHRTTARLWEAEHNAESFKRDRDYARDQLADRQAAELGRSDPRGALVGRILLALGQQGWHGSLGGASEEEVVAAIIDVVEHRRLATRARQELEYLVGEARRMASPLERFAEELERLRKSEAPADV